MTEQQPTTGVVLTNLGTPDAPTAAALRRYLAEFLWDRRVVDAPRPLWWLILHGIILRTRPARSARAYQTVWTEEGSPLMVISRQQCAKLQQQLDNLEPGRYQVELGMRYGNPSIASALERLRTAGIDDIIVLPLYPQNSCSTSGSTFDAVGEALKQTRFVPSIRFVDNYHAEPAYIAALASAIRESWREQEPAQKLLFSFHGTPRRFRDEGDIYYQHCQNTAALVAAALELPPERWMLTFQSRFGREEWLQPYTDVTLKELPSKGIKSVDIICPGFSADCLETLEEIGKENRDYFLGAGGESYTYIPALNAGDEHIAMLAGLITR